MPDDSVRSHLEAIRDCKPHRLPGEVYQHAVAALRLLDEAEVGFLDQFGDDPCRLVPDPDSVCGASTENTPC